MGSSAKRCSQIMASSVRVASEQPDERAAQLLHGFVDFGTVERSITIKEDNFRVAPGLGLRVAIPMLGPAPLAFDFAYPVSKAPTDDRRIFSFYMSLIN